MIVTAHQPAYLPWLGYFEKISRSDIYVFLDEVQFEKNSYINRNKIKTPQGASWLTIPIINKNHTSKTMLDLEIKQESNWQRKHWNAILLNYKKAPYFDEIMKGIEPFYKKEYKYLIDICYEYMIFWLKKLEIKTPNIRFSSLKIKTKKSQMILDICKALNADTYISGRFGKGYLEEEKFRAAGIEIVYQDYVPREYPQLWDEKFLPGLSILDFMMNSKNYFLI